MRFIYIILIVCLFPVHLLAVNKDVLKFDLKFGILKGGEAVLTIRDTTYNGLKAVCYHIQGGTTGITDRLFNVHDVYETIVDARTYLPLKSTKNIKEQKYRYYNEIQFFHEQDSIYSLRKGGKKVPPGLLDIISVFFYFVKNNYTEKIELGDTATFKVFNTENKIDEIRIKNSGVSVVETDLGNFECYVLSPRMDKGKVLKRSDGLKCYVSVAEKIPVQMEFEMKVGTLRAVLRSFSSNGVNRLK